MCRNAALHAPSGVSVAQELRERGSSATSAMRTSGVVPAVVAEEEGEAKGCASQCATNASVNVNGSKSCAPGAVVSAAGDASGVVPAVVAEEEGEAKGCAPQCATDASVNVNGSESCTPGAVVSAAVDASGVVPAVVAEAKGEAKGCAPQCATDASVSVNGSESCTPGAVVSAAGDASGVVPSQCAACTAGSGDGCECNSTAPAPSSPPSGRPHRTREEVMEAVARHRMARHDTNVGARQRRGRANYQGRMSVGNNHAGLRRSTRPRGLPLQQFGPVRRGSMMDHGMPENAIPHLCNAPVRGLPNCATEWVLCDKPLHMEWRQRKGLPSRVVGSNGEHRLRYLSRWTPRREDSLVASAIRLARANRPSVERMENDDVAGGAGGLPSVQCPLPVAAPSPAGTCPHGCVLNHPFLFCSLCEGDRRN